MIVNNTTCVPGNGTDTCPRSPAGLAVGLTLFFLLLVIIAAVVIYKYHSQIRNMVQIGLRRTRRRRSEQKQEDCTETQQADSHIYTSMIRQQSVGQIPIYENLAGQTRPASNQSRSLCGPEEDVYLQCDARDDQIYSNDPACNSMSPEDDVYVVPDAL